MMSILEQGIRKPVDSSKSLVKITPFFYSINKQQQKVSSQ